LFGPTSSSSSTKSTIKPVHKQELSSVFNMVDRDLVVLKGQKEAIEMVPVDLYKKNRKKQSKGESLRSELTGPPLDLNIVSILVPFFFQIT
jgi:hypothetical protein